MKKIIATLTLFLTACSGYAPLYENAGETIDQVVVNDVSMREIERNVGQRRVAQLVQQKLGSIFLSEEGEYNLNVVIEEDIDSLAVQRDATDLRLSLRLSAEVQLFDKDNKEIFKKFITSAAAYNVEDSPFGTDAGRDFARSSAAQKLGDEITYYVTAFMRQNLEK